MDTKVISGQHCDGVRWIRRSFQGNICWSDGGNKKQNKQQLQQQRKIVRSVIAYTHKKDQLWDLLTVSSPVLIRLCSLTGGVSDDV